MYGDHSKHLGETEVMLEPVKLVCNGFRRVFGPSVVATSKISSKGILETQRCFNQNPLANNWHRSGDVLVPCAHPSSFVVMILSFKDRSLS